ncbi:MAG: methionyl-tRNA formyltransferase [Thermodesulfobacteriota bacterium]|nr:methionyl-tRNA formyltransferase [Thermodesulfobacteriota bacterium]
MKIVFMGTPGFALRILEALNDQYDVELVVTQPDKPVGRKKEIVFNPVKKFALDKNLNLLQPDKLKDNHQAVETLKSINPDIVCVAAYGKILPEEILDIPKYGCINVHASILPKYRGAAPINWSLINGEKETGITIMKMDSGMDTGNIISSHKIKINDDDDTLMLTEKLSILSAKKIVEFINNLLLNGSYESKSQNENEATLAPKIKKEDALIDWQKDAEGIRNLIRGCNPWPVAHTHFKDQIIRIFKVSLDNSSNINPGQIVNKDGRLIVGCGQGSIEIFEIQRSGQKRLSGKEFLNGISNIETPIFN